MKNAVFISPEIKAIYERVIPHEGQGRPVTRLKIQIVVSEKTVKITRIIIAVKMGIYFFIFPLPINHSTVSALLA